jgi:hypothetical protein
MLRRILVRNGLAPLLLAALAAGHAGADVIETDFSSQPSGTRILDPSGPGTRPNPRVEDGDQHLQRQRLVR